MTPQREEALRLLRLARRDQETFDLLYPLPKASLAALGFNTQQAVEKSLKAVETLCEIEIRRTHDLTALAQSIENQGPPYQQTSNTTPDQSVCGGIPLQRRDHSRNLS